MSDVLEKDSTEAEISLELEQIELEEPEQDKPEPKDDNATRVEKAAEDAAAAKQAKQSNQGKSSKGKGNQQAKGKSSQQAKANSNAQDSKAENATQPAKAAASSKSSSTNAKQGQAAQSSKQGQAAQSSKQGQAAQSSKQGQAAQATQSPRQGQAARNSASRSSRSTAAASSRQPRAATTTYQKRKPLETQASPESLRQIGMHDTDYRIRGGGFTQAKNPVAYAIVSLIVAAALGLGSFGAWRLVNVLSAERVDQSVITITVDDSHRALESAPRLLDFVYGNADQAVESLVSNGFDIRVNDRSTTDNPDRTARGKEIVYLPPTALPDDLQVYNASEFNDFDFDELQQRLLGSWMLDISNGERGTYMQFKYVNLATDGLSEEMHWLLASQGLTGEGSVIVDEGTDAYGNSFVQGYVVLDGERVVYWRFISCSFDARYKGADTRSIPDSSGYFKLFISTWDFYGASVDQSSD